ncbi:MAG TPA: hypothetical protein PLH22_03005 [Candidatus Colwellbacteria bacterium]|nr:hypothetical protein [Candidatus Colwellbacteria bacterium]
MDEQFQINGVKAENEEEQYPVPETKPVPPPINYAEPISQKKPKIRRWKSFLIILGIIAATELGYLAWNYYLSPEAKENRRIERDFKAYMKFVDQYETAMENDTYGGQTPQETLDMFVDALEKGDLDLASKYFVLREDGSRDPKTLEALESKRVSNILPEMIRLLSEAKPTGSFLKNHYGFKVADDKGNSSIIDFVFNEYSQVWKIETM